jgi:hypothetical protein
MSLLSTLGRGNSLLSYSPSASIYNQSRYPSPSALSSLAQASYGGLAGRYNRKPFFGRRSSSPGSMSMSSLSDPADHYGNYSGQGRRSFFSAYPSSLSDQQVGRPVTCPRSNVFLTMRGALVPSCYCILRWTIVHRLIFDPIESPC